MAKITEEEQKRFLELALVNCFRKKQSAMFKDDLKPPKPTPRPRPRPGAVDLTKTCPNCGSQNILELNRDFNLKWECVRCRAEFDAPVWDKTTDRRWQRSGSAIPDTQQTMRVKKTQYRATRMLKRAARAKKLAAKIAATQARHNDLIAERQKKAAQPVCPNCGRHCYHRQKTRSDGKTYYRCRLCGFIFDQPLKPGKIAASRKPRVPYNAPDWRAQQAVVVERAKERQKAKREQKIADAKARWHEKFDKGEGNDSSGDMPKVQQ